MTVDAETIGGLGRTRTALLRVLLRNKMGLTVDAIAEALGVTRTAVNQHIAALERDGYLVRSEAVATGGRPSQTFALSESGLHLFPKKYDLISETALAMMIDTLGAEKTKSMLDHLGRRLGADIAGEKPGADKEMRARAIVEAMQAFGFDASLEPDKTLEGEAVLRAYNCVYHRLAQAHPEICELDLALLREASGGDVDHLACMAKGDNACRFKLRAAARGRQPSDRKSAR